MNEQVSIDRQTLLTLIEAAESAVEEAELSAEQLGKDGEHDAALRDQETADQWSAAIEAAETALLAPELTPG